MEEIEIILPSDRNRAVPNALMEIHNSDYNIVFVGGIGIRVPKYIKNIAQCRFINNDPNIKIKTPIYSRIVKSSTPGKTYVVKRDETGKWSCTCPGFKWHLKCYHISNTKNEIENERNRNNKL